MTYFQILAVFILPPLLILALLTPVEVWRWLFARAKNRPAPPPDWRPYIIIGGHVLLALVYTTPWDNYLVATNVWWYDPNLVTGITIGYVPIEEYTFFVVQTLLTGFWTLALMRTVFREQPGRLRPLRPNQHLRQWSTIVLGAAWLVSTIVLFSGWTPGTYLTLILSWAFIPVLIQFGFGADILWYNRGLLLAAIIPPTLYLWVLDHVALTDGTWVIDPVQTTGIKLGVIPLEEMVFFFMTNVLIGFGVTLMLSPDSQARAKALLASWRERRKPKA